MSDIIKVRAPDGSMIETTLDNPLLGVACASHELVSYFQARLAHEQRIRVAALEAVALAVRWARPIEDEAEARPSLREEMRRAYRALWPRSPRRELSLVEEVERDRKSVG